VVAERVGMLDGGPALICLGRDLGGLSRPREGAAEEAIEPHPHPPEGLGDGSMLEPALLGEAALAIVGPTPGIGIAGLSVTHQDEVHGDLRSSSTLLSGNFSVNSAAV
jgi:hypothetical protein